MCIRDRNGEVWDPQRPLTSDCSLKLLTSRDEQGMSTLWHSSAHLMAEALESLYPGIKFWVGPPVENGFYYDVDFGDHTFTEGDIPAVEKKMLELAKAKNPFVRKEMSKADAVKYFEEKGDEYKIELIDELEDGSITFLSLIHI